MPSSAQGVLNVYCSVQVEWCTLLANEFQKATGVKVSITQKGSGETIAQLKAEAQNPKGDVWFGGTGDPHLQAAEENLTEIYKSPKMSELQPWAVKQNTDSGGKTVGIYMGALGYGYNTELLAKKGVKPPACWADLLKPEFKGEIQMANPNSSGTAYVAIATLVQLMGEEKAFDYLKKMHANVNAYTRSGTAPMKAVARMSLFAALAVASRAAAPTAAPARPPETGSDGHAASGQQHAGHLHRLGEAGRIGPSRAGQIEGCAVVRAGAHEGQAQRHVDALLHAQVLHRDQPLVMGHGHHQVKFAGMVGRVTGTHEDGVWRKRALRIDAFLTGRCNGRRDGGDLFIAKKTAFPCVGVEPSHGDAGGLTPDTCGPVGNAQGLQHGLKRHRIQRLAQ